jgi:TatD DNase family protein
MSLRFYDAHNHLQDERFGGRQAELIAECERAGVARMVVNGSCEEDWSQVLELTRHTQVVPSFGYHPWYIHERTPEWQKNLIHFLAQCPSAVGEIGLDRWKSDLDYSEQEEVFIAQLQIAAERNLPVSIHCLQAWGRMFEILRDTPRPRCGFLLHSYGGPKEMVKSLGELGAYFSLPGYFAHERKERQREVFRHVPPGRLLLETDAPDQMMPSIQNEKIKSQNDSAPARVFSLTNEKTSEALNHPANISAVYEFASALFGESLESLATRVEENFFRLFGGVTQR